ncbi:sugar ABC transporter substrate-binding protein [Paenibacillus nanensis]|uniref:Sugar ABC transporter substrate-binding protein n=1 Tax=Paenibacillus nanensis TaxID=393251 RepID=A0A3A1VM92_9BACL|nr:sugar ABC transporter substrate-binding protein [Paenibacillus nanensis]RIX59633.1 sugar ABC transporter substrate-binding protein [Paenibacillus nanensis]
MKSRALFAVLAIGAIAGVVWLLLRPPAAPSEDSSVKGGDRQEVTLKFTYWGSVEEKNAIENALSRFSEAYPWIKVEATQLPNSDFNTKMLSLSASNDEPDISYMTTELGEVFARNHKFVNLLDFLERDPELKKEDFLDYLWYYSSPDFAWGISTAAESFGLFYRRDLLGQAGVSPPPAKAEEAWTWEQFVEAAQKLTLDRNGRNAADPLFDSNHIVRYGVMFETWVEPLNNFIFSNGGEWISPDGRQFTLNSPQTAEAIQKLADLTNVYHVAPSPYASKQLPSLNVALQAGLTAMIIDGQWINLDLGKAKTDYDIGVLPKLKKSVTVGLSGATVIYQSSKHPEEAWLLYKWLSDPNKAIELYADGLWMPVFKQWYTDPALIDRWVNANPAAHPPGFKDAMMRQLLENGIPSVGYYLHNQKEIYPEVTAGLLPVLQGEKSAQEALDDIAEQVGKYFSQ